MEGFISKAFARSGFRRRELVARLVKPQGPVDSEALQELLDKPVDGLLPGADSASPRIRKPNHGFLDKWDMPKLRLILGSQKKQQGATKSTTSWSGSTIKAVDDRQYVPELNIWGNPPSEILVRAKRARWWRAAAERIMPPLGRGEWELLGQLANGAQNEAEWAVPGRRQAAKALFEPEDASSGWDWRAYATMPACEVEKPKTLGNQRRSGQRDTGPHAVRQRKPDMSARWFRRQYSRTWQLTPTMNQDPNTLKYSLQWGKARSRIATPTRHQLDIFLGVDQQGRKTGKDAAK